MPLPLLLKCTCRLSLFGLLQHQLNVVLCNVAFSYLLIQIYHCNCISAEEKGGEHHFPAPLPSELYYWHSQRSLHFFSLDLAGHFYVFFLLHMLCAFLKQWTVGKTARPICFPLEEKQLEDLGCLCVLCFTNK